MHIAQVFYTGTELQSPHCVADTSATPIDNIKDVSSVINEYNSYGVPNLRSSNTYMLLVVIPCTPWKQDS